MGTDPRRKYGHSPIEYVREASRGGSSDALRALIYWERGHAPRSFRVEGICWTPLAAEAGRELHRRGEEIFNVPLPGEDSQRRWREAWEEADEDVL